MLRVTIETVKEAAPSTQDQSHQVSYWSPWLPWLPWFMVSMVTVSVVTMVIGYYMVTYEIVGVVNFLKISTFSFSIRSIFVKSIPKIFLIKYFTTLLL